MGGTVDVSSGGWGLSVGGARVGLMKYWWDGEVYGARGGLGASDRSGVLKPGLRSPLRSG